VAVRALLLAEDFSQFTMEVVARKADVSRLRSTTNSIPEGLLEAFYNAIARSGHLGRLPKAFRFGDDPLQKLHNFIEVLVRFGAPAFLMTYVDERSDFDQHVAVLDLEGIDRDFCARVVHARLRIPLPPVPRADHLAIEDDSVAKRPATMQADVIHRGVFAIHVGNADLFFAAAELFGLVDLR